MQVKKYILGLDDDLKIKMIENMDLFELEGKSLWSSVLRKQAMVYLGSVGICKDHIDTAYVSWVMECMVKECHLYFSRIYLNNLKTAQC